METPAEPRARNSVVKVIATAVTVLATIPLTLFLAWVLLVAVCNFPPLAFSVACGHNAYVWFPVLIPLSGYVSWKTLNGVKNALLRSAIGSVRHEL